MFMGVFPGICRGQEVEPLAFLYPPVAKSKNECFLYTQTQNLDLAP